MEGARRLPRAVAYDVPPLLQAHQGLIKECKGSRLAKLTSGSARVGSGGTQTPKVGSFCAVVSRLTRHRIGKYRQPDQGTPSNSLRRKLLVRPASSE